ncbi:MAG TPA: hypothetical protein VF631_01550 [Allosphingosinicella sp.]|uniref:hypothetical protein n=1 Tax=Allosphingosinicella sp. TaxID=2823234 RepID=UPI002F291C85
MLKRTLRVAVPSIAAICALAFVGHRATTAADHNEPASRTEVGVDPTPDRAADLADVYAFHDANNLVLAITFAGPAAINLPAVYDPNVLYRIHLSTDGNRATTEIPIDIRFGFDGTNPGVQIKGLPDIPVIQGPVETTFGQGGYLIRAGLFDDPFFFDLQGLRETRSTGALRFNNMRSSFANANITGVVIQIPRIRIENGNNQIDVWSEAGRFGGQL